jgi:hypothetical protein
MARLAGFEPTTPWFVAKYSIQLSYRREARIIAEAGLAALPRIGPPQRHIPAMALDAEASFDYAYAGTRLHLIRPEPIR